MMATIQIKLLVLTLLFNFLEHERLLMHDFYIGCLSARRDVLD